MRLGKEEFRAIVSNQVGWGWIIQTYNTLTSNMVYSASQKGMDCYYTILRQLKVSRLFNGPSLREDTDELHLQHINELGLLTSVEGNIQLSKNGAEWVYVFLAVLNRKTWGYKNRLYKRAFMKMIEIVTLSWLRMGYSFSDYFNAKTKKIEEREPPKRRRKRKSWKKKS